jgi:hypothetical protein
MPKTFIESRTNSNQQDETWAKLSRLDSSILVYATQLRFLQKQPNLKSKTQTKQLSC